MSHNMTQKVNSFALRAFRDTAVRDYIHARMAYRAELFPQFHWSALHAEQCLGLDFILIR